MGAVKLIADMNIKTDLENELLQPSELDRYEYHLQFWGQIEKDRWIEHHLGVSEKDFWFSSKNERDDFKAQLEYVAKFHKVNIMFSEHEGYDVRKRTVARMTFILPDGRSLPFEYDFGYAYSIEGAEFMFMDGNYACDCNRSRFLSRAYPGVVEIDCGDKIIIQDFVVIKELPHADKNDI